MPGDVTKKHLHESHERERESQRRHGKEPCSEQMTRARHWHGLLGPNWDAYYSLVLYESPYHFQLFFQLLMLRLYRISQLKP